MMKDRLKEIFEQTNLIHFEGGRREADYIIKDMDSTAGIVDDEDGLYENMTVRQYLDFFARLEDTKETLVEAVEQMHLSDLLKTKIGKCTNTEKKRIGIARELLRKPSILLIINLLEEADEKSRKLLLGWMESLAGENRKLITISHSHRNTCLCPGSHYEIVNGEINCIDEMEASEDNPELPVISKISVTYQEKTFLFNPEEIDYAEAHDGQVYVYVQSERYMGNFKMSELEEKLVHFGFFRCHRSYIVNMQKVTELVKWTRNSYSLKLVKYEKTDIPLSKGKIQKLKSMYEF